MPADGPIDALAAACRHRAGTIAVCLSAGLAALYLIWQPQTLDLSAQAFRADLWESDGWVVWSPAWYGGFTVPGYSLIYPPLGALLGPALVGALSAVAATALFASIATRAYGERAWLGVIWFGLASAVAPFGGRTTFTLGLAVGLACVGAVQRRRAGVAGVGGLAAAASSPVAGLFTAIACLAVTAADRSPSASIGRAQGPVAAALAGAAGALAGLAALALAFPTDGFQPFALSAWIWIPLVVAATLALTRSDEAVLRWGALIYLGVAAVALVHESPLGGNVVRLGLTFSGPLLAIVLLRRRPLLLALLALPLLWWQWTATVRDLAAATGDPSTERAYYEPLLGELAARTSEGPVRIEVPPSRNRWEARYVAGRFPLARGWLRQLEADDLDLFDGDSLDAESYRRWLAESGVSYVALSDAEPDYLAERESELLREGVPGLEQVWSNEHWRLFRIRGGGADPLVAGPARLLAAGPDRVRVEMRAPRASIAFRSDHWLGVVSDGACSVSPDPERGDGWMRISAPGASATTPKLVELGLGRSLSCD